MRLEEQPAIRYRVDVTRDGRKGFTVALMVALRSDRPDQFVVSPTHGSITFSVARKRRRWRVRQLYPEAFLGYHVPDGLRELELVVGPAKEDVIAAVEAALNAHAAALMLGYPGGAP